MIQVDTQGCDREPSSEPSRSDGVPSVEPPVTFPGSLPHMYIQGNTVFSCITMKKSPKSVANQALEQRGLMARGGDCYRLLGFATLGSPAVSLACESHLLPLL